MSDKRSPTRTLTLLRHAKSSWKDPGLSDIERPLTKRGRRAADAMAPRLVQHGASFHCILASPARRSRETIARMLLALPAQDAQLTFDQGLYTFERDGLLQWIRQLDDLIAPEIDEVMLVGHNPALQEALHWLIGEGFTGEAPAEFPTCAAAQITLHVPRWSKIKEGCAQLMWVLVPEGEIGLNPPG